VPTFVPGLQLARAFYTELVRPALDVPHAAALIGPGSEILGFDTERSTDHHWGPRVLLFLRPDDKERRDAIFDQLANALPPTFGGWSTNFGPAGEDGARLLAEIDDGPVAHRVEIHEAGEWFRHVLGFDPAAGVPLSDWLATPSQLLLSVTAGEVFADDLDVLRPRRRALDWYPRDVWAYLVGCQWQRFAQEEAFVGRTGEVGDDLGSRLVAARLVRDLMRLCFLLERRYAPYTKWLGTAFARLAGAGELAPFFARALTARNWPLREAAIGKAASIVARMHNEAGITDPVDTTRREYYERPFLVLRAERFADACFAAISEPAVAGLAHGVGAVDQWIDSTNVLSAPRRARRASSGLHEFEQHP
jgi:hypothetical protein